MSEISYLESLKKKHKDLHSIIESLEAEKAPVHCINNKKKEKLMIKDKISFMEKKVVANE